MAKAKVEKITLSQARDIPFDKLVLSNRNVRRVRAGVSIEELAEDIARRTLLQSLSVRPVIGENDQPAGTYEVQAGGRRFRALELLVKQKRLAKNAPIPCIVREDGILEEDSLAENVQRVSLHPLDQFRAFQSLAEQGLGEEEIAARFFVTPQIVRQRLKLASVSPKLLQTYAADEMSLEQLMAFSISDDHARQEQVWEAIRRGWTREPHYIRQLLTENTVRAGNKRARFIGLDAYEAAGGIVLRDLFSQNDDGWLQDVALLEKLVTEKLTAEAEAIKAEGWKWVEVAQDFPYGHTAGLGRITGEVEPLSEDEHARRESLREEMAQIEERYCDTDEDLPDEVDRRLAEIEEELDAFEHRPVRHDPDEIARAGAFVSIDGDGRLKVERGYVRSEDETSAIGNSGEDQDGTAAAANADAAVGGADTASIQDQAGGETVTGDDDAERDGLKPLSDRLVMELTAHRTLGLRNALADDPDAAFLATLHALALQTFYRYATESCLEITAKQSGFSVQGPDLKESASAKAIDERHANWERQLPREPKDLWGALRAFDADSRSMLFAHCVSLAVNAVHEPWNRAPGRRHHADQLAEALALDMAAAGWKPTVDSYLNRVPKARILEAVMEAKGVAAAQLIDHLKKGDMAEQAERLIAGTGWLPEPLRTPGVESMAMVDTDEPAAPGAEVAVQEDAAADLPGFLTAAE